MKEKLKLEKSGIKPLQKVKKFNIEKLCSVIAMVYLWWQMYTSLNKVVANCQL